MIRFHAGGVIVMRFQGRFAVTVSIMVTISITVTGTEYSYSNRCGYGYGSQQELWSGPAIRTQSGVSGPTIRTQSGVSGPATRSQSGVRSLAMVTVRDDDSCLSLHSETSYPFIDCYHLRRCQISVGLWLQFG